MEVLQSNRPATSLRAWLPARGKWRGLVAGAMLATGMTALAAPQKQAAILLTPVKLEPGERPAVARGAMDDFPGAAMGSTPVARKGTGGSPAWLNGADPNVLPASGSVPSRSATEARPALGSSAKDIPPLTPPKLLSSPSANKPADKLKLPAMGERLYPPGIAGGEVPPQDPNMPLRGTAANGAPLMAGPPAYRWYGYGSVTPGANAFAPTGEYPKASANWYGVTGATPGAFPVPVVNPYRAAPGNEPPEYTVAPPPPPPRPTSVPPGVAMGHVYEAPKNVVAVPPPMNTSAVPPASAMPAVPSTPPVGSIGSSPGLPLPPLPQPVGIPTMPAAPTASVPAPPSAPLKVEPAPVIPVSLGKPIAGLPVVATKPAEATTPKPAAPETLPPALREDPLWKPSLPTSTPDQLHQPGAKIVKPEITARGQMPDASRPDPMLSMIQGMCKGRADGIDVRWTGTKKLTVCFEVRSQPEAKKLVTDISARPELTPLAIDFCIVVK